VIVSWL